MLLEGEDRALGRRGRPRMEPEELAIVVTQDGFQFDGEIQRGRFGRMDADPRAQTEGEANADESSGIGEPPHGGRLGWGWCWIEGRSIFRNPSFQRGCSPLAALRLRGFSFSVSFAERQGKQSRQAAKGKVGWNGGVGVVRERRGICRPIRGLGGF